MKSLPEIIAEAAEKKLAIGHFNISDLAALKAIFKAAQELQVPIIIGVSEGEREFIGPSQAVALIKSFRDQYSYPIFLNADHTYSLDKIKEAVEVGYDAVIFDGARLPLEENLQKTREAVAWVKSKKSEVVVEGEIGYIGASSKLLGAVPQGVELTRVEDAVSFTEETGVQMLAPAVGNIHGMLVNIPEPRLDIERIKAIKEAVKIPLVLHGASGNSDEDLKAAILAGITIIHINTEIRIAWRRGLEQALGDNPDEITPYKLLGLAEAEIYKVVLNRLKLFNGLM